MVMRVIPVDPGITKMDSVLERTAGLDRFLRHMRNAVEPVVEPDAVPVHGRREVGAIGELHDNGRPFVDPSIVTVRPNNTRRTGAATRGSTLPSVSGSSSRGRASGIELSARGR